ncbi:2TM domain-containing protein [Flavobacterium coralii]|jgi:hypothetical protein|uniref:2TM domain-containing protein n=1 Tax=Flavobacterium coralii TaxID=2838017 RepID=UPI0032B2C2BE|tara:strand:+ start:16746 stop:17060 length:315 start_codon:yes stop_codon:yes gene_type:complete
MEIIMEANNNKLAYERARKKVKDIKGFYVNLMCYCIVIPILIFLNLYYTPQYYWFLFSMIGWGSGLLIHGLAAFGYMPFMSREWEEKKLKKFLEEEKQQRSKFR